MIIVSKVEIFHANFPISRLRKICAVLMFLTGELRLCELLGRHIVYPTKKKPTTQIFQLISFKCENANNCHKILIFDQILLKLRCGVDEYLCFSHAGTKASISLVNMFLRHLFNDAVCVKFRACFTIANYENNIFSLCETSNAFIHALCHSKMHFHQR